MPDFHIPGDPAAIDGRVALMSSRATGLTNVGTGLSSITTDGWVGRAADRFHERFDVEPERWTTAGSGFSRAAVALGVYAAALRTAQQRAQWCAGEYARGEGVTQTARTAYDQDVRRAQREVNEAATRGDIINLTIHPFQDPGASIRNHAVAEFGRAKQTLDAAAATCAHEVRAGCSAAHKRRNWLESGLNFLGEVVYGAGEAIYQLGKLIFDLQYGPYIDLFKLASGELTPEELAAKNQLKLETAQALWTALTTDPVGFGLQIGSAILDVDTWKDNPGRALGRLVPDIVAAVFTGGAATAATRGGRALQMTMRVLGDLSGVNLVRGGAGLLRRGVDALTSTQYARHLDDLTNGRVVESVADLQGARYLRPSEETSSLLADAVAASGRTNPSGYISKINPLLLEGPEYANNCGPVSRAFADTFHGVETRVAPGDVNLGEFAEMRGATNTNPVALTFDAAVHADTAEFSGQAYDAVTTAAANLPDGTAMIVGVDWDGGGGHWFNAIVENGNLKWVDGQSGNFTDWPPGYGSNITTIDVVHRPDGSTAWSELDLGGGTP